MKKLNLQSPWVTYYNKIRALFDGDEEVSISDISPAEENTAGIDVDYEFMIVVCNKEKYIAMTQLMPRVVEFGNVKLGIEVCLVGEDDGYSERIKQYEALFKGNHHVKDIKDVIDQAGVHHGFVRFYPDIVQFYNDDISDYSCNWTGLLHDIAKEIFTSEYRGVNFCIADVKENEPKSEE